MFGVFYVCMWAVSMGIDSVNYNVVVRVCFVSKKKCSC